MMLPTSNPKSPKRRHQQLRLRDILSPKVIAISLFMFLNVGWFLYTMLASHHRNSSPQPGGRTGMLQSEAHQKAGGLYGTQNQASYAGKAAGDAHDSRTSVQGQGTAGRRPWESSEGGLFQPHGASSQQQQPLGSGGGASASAGTALKSGAAIEDLVVKGSVTSGDLKLTGNILSSSSGKLLVSAGVVGVGTSMLDAEHDKLVVNGPIRLTDAGARPSCELARRGMIWHEFGEMGQADTVDVCAKGQNDDYAWRPVIGGGGALGSSSSAQARQQWAPAQSQQQLGAGALGGGADSSLSREFRVAGGSELRAGDVVTFVEGHAKRGMTAQLGSPVLFSQPGQAEGGSGGASKRRTTLLALSHDLCLVIHSAGAAAKVSAQVAKVHGTNTELAAKQPFGPHRAEQVDLAALSPREFIMVYNEPMERNAGYVVLGNVVGNSAKVFSQPVAMEPSGCNSLSVAALSPSLVVIAFNADTANGHGTPVVLAASVEGRKVVLGNRTKLTGRMDGFVVVPMSISTFVLVHRNIRQKGASGRVGHVAMVQQAEAPEDEDAGEDGQQQQQQMEIVPKAFVAEDVPLFSSTRVLTYLAATRLSSWQIAIAYADGNEGNVLLAGVVGDSLTPQPAAPFSSAKPLSLSLSPLSESAFILSFYTHDPWRAVVVKGSVQQLHQQERAGPGLSLFETTVTTDYTTHTHSLALSPHTFLMTYYDGANSDAGTAVVGVFGRGMGVAGAPAAEGEMVPVRFGGISGDHESLEVGSCYYSNEEGRVTTFASELRVGLAVSVSEILMGGC